MPAKIKNIDSGSTAERIGLRAGDVLCSINGKAVSDVLDYQFYSYDSAIDLGITRGSEKLLFSVKKSEGEPLGIDFESYLMDEQKSCANKCIFCFIDQLPCGMRDTLYFKDDDARLSFLIGNYITMTNLSERDVERIIKMRVSPLNISVHTTEPDLRTFMLGNRRGGDSLKHLDAFVRARLDIKAQIVVCPGVNDGEHLKKTLSDLSLMAPSVSSVAIVPVGITKHRAGLCELNGMDKNCAREVLDIIDAARAENMARHGEPLVYASDEIYLKADLPIPSPAYYDSYDQLENGIGLMSLLREEVEDALPDFDLSGSAPFTIATGTDAAPYIKKLLDYIATKWHNLSYEVIAVKNDFFGHTVSVAGLLTGGDIISQLSGKIHGKRLILPICMLRHKENVFLDDTTVSDIENALGVRVLTCAVDGAQFLSTIGGKNE